MSEKKAQKKRGRGQPTLYRPEYCDLLITHFKSGKSYAAFAALCDVTRDTLYEWERVHPEFSYAKKKGLEHAQAWWEQVGIDGLYKQTFSDDDGTRTVQLNATVWLYTMKCRFREDWHEPVKDQEQEKPETDEQRKARLASLIAYYSELKGVK